MPGEKKSKFRISLHYWQLVTLHQIEVALRRDTKNQIPSFKCQRWKISRFCLSRICIFRKDCPGNSCCRNDTHLHHSFDSSHWVFYSQYSYINLSSLAYFALYWSLAQVPLRATEWSVSLPATFYFGTIWPPNLIQHSTTNVPESTLTILSVGLSLYVLPSSPFCNTVSPGAKSG